MTGEEERGRILITPGAVVVSERREWLIGRVEESVSIESFGMLVFEGASVDKTIIEVSERNKKACSKLRPVGSKVRWGSLTQLHSHCYAALLSSDQFLSS